METIIVICLLIIIVLLVQDKIAIRKRSEQKPTQEKTNPNLSDIMGQPKPIRKRHTMPNKVISSQENKATTGNNNFDSEEQGYGQIPQEELDNVFNEVPDFEEEEEEWHQYREPNGENGFATGVTFEELNTVGILLQKEVLKPSQQQEAVDIVQRIQGTELFSLLENSLEGASQKIAKLLDRSLSDQTNSGSSILRKNDLKDFDIGEFL